MKKIFLSIFVALAALSAMYLFSYKKKPNIILISIDGIRNSHLQINGYKKQVTPELNQFAQEAIYFKNYFSTGYITPVSEASVQTGLYPFKNKMIDFAHLIDSEVPMLAEILKKSNYSTYAFGNAPEFKMSAPGESFTRGFDHYDLIKIQRHSGKSFLNFSNIVEKISQESKPFFLWVPLSNAHAPYINFKEFKNYDETYKGPFSKYEFDGNAHFYYDNAIYPITDKNKIVFYSLERTDDKHYVIDKLAIDFPKRPTKTDQKDLAQLINLYDEGLSSADQQLANLFKTLKEKGLYDNTIIIIETPRGESLNEHKYIGHYDIYDTTVNVPLFFKPEKEIQGYVSSRLVSGVDILPSLLSYLNIFDSKYQFDGKRDVFQEPNLQDNDDHVFITRTPLWEINLKAKNSDIFDKLRLENDQHPYFDTAIRNKKWKVIHRRSRFALKNYSLWTFISGIKLSTLDEFEVYNLSEDPTEIYPLNSFNPETESLRLKLIKWETNLNENYRAGQKTKRLQTYR